MPSDSPYKGYDGGYLAPFTGRDQLLQDVRQWLSPESPTQLVFFAGESGTGKTRLLVKTLEIAQDLKLVCAETLIDFKDIKNHSLDGLQKSIVDALKKYSEFKNYVGVSEEMKEIPLDDMRLQSEYQLKLRAAFDNDIKELALKNRLVLALDTAEQIVYSVDSKPPKDEKKEAEQLVDNDKTESSRSARPDIEVLAWPWLKQAIPTWENAIVFIAGRPEIEDLEEDLKKGPATKKETRKLEDFVKNECSAYIAAVCEEYRTGSKPDPQFANQLQTLIEYYNADLFDISHGNPILLGMMIALYRVTPYDEFSIWLETLKNLPDNKSRDMALEVKLVDHLVTNKEMEPLVTTLGALQKGATEELFVKLLAENQADSELEAKAKHIFKTTRETPPVFVKIFPENKDLAENKDQTKNIEPASRLFLHDRLYDMLDKHYFELPVAINRNRDNYAIIKEYYQTELAKSTIPNDRQEKPRDIQTKRIELQSEYLFYTLRQNPAKGLRLFFRYQFEAMLGSAPAYTIYQSELLNFTKKHKDTHPGVPIPGIPEWVIESIQDQSARVNAFALGKWELLTAQAIDYKARIEQPQSPPLNSNTFQAIWVAWALALAGNEQDLQRGEAILQELMPKLQMNLAKSKVAASPDEQNTIWLTETLLGVTHRIQGYIHRLRGNMRIAAAEYRDALKLFDKNNIQILKAGTANDLGYVLAELGEETQARELVNTALALRSALVLPYQVGLSLNTLALIEMRQGALVQAEKYSKDASERFGGMQSVRGNGLAMTAQAEIWRRMASSTSNLQERTANLEKALDFAEKAVQAFDKPREQLRYIEALIEQGCVYRDQVTLLRATGQEVDMVSEQGRLCFQEAIVATITTIPDKQSEGAITVAGTTFPDKQLEGAIAAAGTTFLYKRLDATINLAMLEHNAENDSQRQAAIKRANALIDQAGKDYRFVPLRGKPRILIPDLPRKSKSGMPTQQPNVFFWTQLGKLNAFEARIALESFFKADPTRRTRFPKYSTLLETAAEKYLLALEYNLLYSPKYRELESTRQRIRGDLARLSSEERREFGKFVEQKEKRWGFTNSELRKLTQA